jgi:hypothetical protein
LAARTNYNTGGVAVDKAGAVYVADMPPLHPDTEEIDEYRLDRVVKLTPDATSWSADPSPGGDDSHPRVEPPDD